MAESFTLVFTKERETKNTIRYQEQETPDRALVMGVVYLQKWAAKQLGAPESLTVTVTR